MTRQNGYATPTGNEDAANARGPETYARLHALEKTMGVSRCRRTSRPAQKADDRESSSSEDDDEDDESEEADDELDDHGVYLHVWEDKFVPFKRFTDAGCQKRFEALPAKLKRSTRVLIADWYDLQQREDLLWRILGGEAEVTTPKTRAVVAAKAVQQERRAAEEDIDEMLARSGYPGLYIFTKLVGAAEKSADNDDALSAKRTWQKHLDVPKFGMEGATHTDIVDYLDDFESVAEEIGCLDPGWYMLLKANCRGEIQEHIKASMLPTTKWAEAKECLHQCFAGRWYEMDITLALLAMKPEPGEQQKRFLERVSAAYAKYMRVTKHRQSPLLYYVFYKQLTGPTQAYVDDRAPDKDKQTPTTLSHIVCESPWSKEKLLVETTANRKPPIKRADKWCEVHRVTTHDTSECHAAKKRQELMQPATLAKRGLQAANAAPTTAGPGGLRCFQCNQLGHMARNCNVPKASINLTTATTMPPTEHAPTLAPIKIAGIEALAFFDTGSDTVHISAAFVAQHNIETTSTRLVVTGFGEQTCTIDQMTVPLLLECGEMREHLACYVAPTNPAYQIVIGMPLLRLIGVYLANVPYKLPGTFEPTYPQPVNKPAMHFAQVDDELSGERARLLERLAPLLAANAAITPDAACPLPEAVVRLPTREGETAFRQQYRLPERVRPTVQAQVEDWLETSTIGPAPVQSTFNAPMFPIPKKDADGNKTLHRICHDYRELNALTFPDKHPLPLITEIFDRLAGSVVFSTIDLQSAFHRFAIAEEDRHKTAFTWQGTQYVFNRAPFGLRNLLSIFQRVMQRLFGGLPYVLCYIDNIVVFSTTTDAHPAQVEKVLEILTAHNLVVNVAKCHFLHTHIRLLGFIITPAGRKVDEDRLANIRAWPMPRTRTELQKLLGIANYLRAHVPLMAQVSAPLDAIRNADDLRAVWKDEHMCALALLQQAILEALALLFPDDRMPYLVATDASGTGIGAVLYQIANNGTHRYLACQSRALSASERNYSATKRELLAVVYAIRSFHQYLYGRRFTLFTDHAALTHMHTQEKLNAMLIGWFEEIAWYDFEVVHRPGVLNVLPDALSRIHAPQEEGEQPSAAIHTTRTAIGDPQEREHLIDREHLRGHFGEKAIATALRAQGTTWPNMRRDIAARVAACKICQRHKRAPVVHHPLQQITADSPFDHVAVDLAGPFPTSTAGNHYLHVLVDIHTRFVTLDAMPDKKALTVAGVWAARFSMLGFPRIIQSDNGTEFIGHVMKQLARATNMDHRFITPYNPRANGAAERTVQTATRVLNKLVEGHKAMWDQFLPHVQYAINTKVSARHGITPFLAMFGREANALEDHSDAEPLENEATPEQIATIHDRVLQMRASLFPAVVQRTKTTADRVSTRFDEAHTIKDLPIGSLVMVRGTAARKLEPSNVGPFKIVAKIGVGSYALEDHTGAPLPRKYATSQLQLLADTVDENEDYVEIDAILGHRNYRSGKRYHVRWTDGDEGWVTPEDFGSLDIIHEYWDKLNASQN